MLTRYRVVSLRLRRVDMHRHGLMQTQNAYTMPTRNPESKKPSRVGWAKCLNSLVGRE